MADRELFLVEITWETYPEGEEIHRISLNLMEEDATLICDSASGINPTQMINEAIRLRKGWSYTTSEPITCYWFDVLKTTNRSDWPKELFRDTGAEEFFGGTLLDKIKALRQSVCPLDKGDMLTLWEMHYFRVDEDDFDNEWSLLGAVDVGSLEQCLIRKGENLNSLLYAANLNGLAGTSEGNINGS